MVLFFRLFRLFLGQGWTVYGFRDLGGFLSYATVHGFLESRAFMGSKVMTNFWGNFCFGVVLCFGLFWVYGWALFGFGDLRRFHSSAKVHRFLES